MKQAWNVFSSFFVYYAVCIVVGNVFREAMYESPAEISTLAAFLTIPFLMLMVKNDKKKDAEAMIPQVEKAPLKKYGMIVVLSIFLTIALNNIILALNLAAYSERYQNAIASLYAPDFFMQIISAGIIFPIMEEYLFRGLIYRRIRPIMSMNWAIFLSALFFGMYHGNLVQMIYGLFAGLALAFVYEKYGSMKAPILMHIVMNISSILLTAAGGFLWMFSNTIRACLLTVVSLVIVTKILKDIANM